MQVSQARMFIGRLPFKSDLLEALTGFCGLHRVTLGTFSVIGALSEVKLGYYLQDEKRYVECVHLEKKLEIASCTGNISLKDNEIFVHAHVTLADHTGVCYGGHLMSGARIFAAEYCITELAGGVLERVHDPGTGLHLWHDKGGL
ncbi:MAG: DUF296 domain-containing protein [Candidatus Omnitrophica bacterium]|nr:DUF296 domain-containing protein [Candidatus Omnitrophota bacterium]